MSTYHISTYRPRAVLWQAAVTSAALLGLFPSASAGQGNEVAVEVQLIPLEPSIVAAARSGLIEKVLVEQGQLVSGGDLVVELDSRKASLESQRAKTDLQVARFKAEDDIPVRHAEKSMALAKTELKRAEVINERIKGSISQREIDALRLTSERAALAVEQAEREHEVAILELQLMTIAHEMTVLDVRQHRLQAPIGGVVVEVHKKAGEWVESGEGVLEVVPVDRLRAEGFAAASDAMRIGRGAPAVLQIEAAGGGEEKINGRVVFVAPEANPVNGLIRVRTDFPRGRLALRPGMVGVVLIDCDGKLAGVSGSPGRRVDTP